MLTQDDLKAIGTIVGEQIDAKVPPMIDALEERMNVKFDAVHEELEGIRSQMVTKDYLDRRLTEYVRKPV